MKKRSLVLMMTIAMGVSIIGCGASSNSESEVKNQVETSATEGTTQNDSTVTVNEDEDTNTLSTQETTFVGGIWGTNSISGENENYPASYYVQFTDSEVNFGHMSSEGKFEVEYSDKISSITELSPGIYCVQAETDDGHQFTYQTNEDDKTIMDYYSTWDESEFGDNYSGSYSISKCL